MKKFLVVIAVIALIIGSLYYYAMFTLHKTETETIDIAKTTIIAISNPWNAAELERRLYPPALEKIKATGQSPEEIYKIWSKLGNFKQVNECHLRKVGSESGATFVTYHCIAEYENGPADIMIMMREDSQDAWKISDLVFQSPIFLDLLKK